MPTNVPLTVRQVQKASEKAGMDPKTFCDQGAQIFKDLATKAGVSNEHFVRTTDQEHKDAVEYAWVGSQVGTRALGLVG